MVTQQMYDGYLNAFGPAKPAARFFHAPGRVNLIGEHTDYNGGYVFPCALSLGTYGAACGNNDGIIRLASGNDSLRAEFDLRGGLSRDVKRGWANYPLAVVSEMEKLGCKTGGFNLYVAGDVPSGTGLSSSASLEMLTAVAVNSLFGFGLNMLDLVKLSQRAENNFVGVNCGIMDQFASGFGKAGSAVLLQCQSLEYRYVPLDLRDCVIIIANTNKPRGLADSKYNERRGECAAAFDTLKKYVDADSLCGISPEDFEKNRKKIGNETVARRAAHAVYENARTLQAVGALTNGELECFGKLMNDSHVSLRDLYEVTGAELDALAGAAWQTEGCVGSRMTGAGFGGCTVSIVRATAVNKFKEKVGAEYKIKTGLDASFYTAETGDGAREI